MEENINIAKILENAPKGLKLYSSLCGECQYDHLSEGLVGYDIYVTTLEDDYTYCFNQDGIYMDGGECLLFPSKDHRTWDNNWQEVLFKKGDIIVSIDKVPILYYEDKGSEYSVYNKYGERLGKTLTYLSNCRYATPEEREQFFKELNNHGYAWNTNTKQMERSLQQKTSKYKVGDYIIRNSGNLHTVAKVNEIVTHIGNVTHYRLFHFDSSCTGDYSLKYVESDFRLATEQELNDAGIKCSNSEYNTNIDNQVKNNTFYYPEQETEVEVTPDGCYKCVLKTEKKKPKFSIGDYIVGDDETIYKIMDVHGTLYTLYDYSNQNKFKQTIKKIDENHSLVTDQELIDAGIKNQHHKFKAGDVIRNKETGIVCKINYLAKNWYIFYKNKNQSGLKYENEDKWELVTVHKTKSKRHYVTRHRVFFNWIYDRLVSLYGENPNVDYMQSLKERIDDLFPETEETDTTSEHTEEKPFTIDDLKPFDRVLVKYQTGSKWGIELFERYDNDLIDYPYICLRSVGKYCIPYNDETKHLLGTTDDYKGKYKTWED